MYKTVGPGRGHTGESGSREPANVTSSGPGATDLVSDPNSAILRLAALSLPKPQFPRSDFPVVRDSDNITCVHVVAKQTPASPAVLKVRSQDTCGFPTPFEMV